MDGLRWLLLLLGLLVIASVYFYSRRESRKSDEPLADLERKSPTIGHEDEGPFPEPDIPHEPDTFDDVPRIAEEAPQKIVTLRLISRGGTGFKGNELILSMRGIGLRHGKFGIFHRIDGDDDERIIFSAASLVEPGSFDMTNIAEQEIPGISLFMVLPGPVDSVEAFDMMMEAARALAQSLNAELLDESGSTLSIQRERYMREEVIQYQHSNLVA